MKAIIIASISVTARRGTEIAAVVAYGHGEGAATEAWSKRVNFTVITRGINGVSPRLEAQIVGVCRSGFRVRSPLNG